ncbi:MAG: hypothetical protein BIFFINMI_03175 [Phycisphaerae bacterium]|nr:hypothetical protein [Phycisphaerae bacterium]
MYRFAQTAARLPEANLVARPPSPDGAPPAAPAAADQPAPPGSERRTDPATAIDQVFANADGEHASVAAIIIITDGNFNADAPGDPGALARQRGVPIFPIRIGSTAPPPDLAVLKLDAPTSLYKDDTATVSAEVKMDGLAGREVTVALRQLDASGRPGAVLQTRTLHPTDAAQRGSVEFKFTPATTGTLGYTVTASLAGGVEFHDVMPDNDAQQFSMAVTDERTNVLLIDGPPRWEFRYLRGLLQRDRGVLVQHLVETPAFIRGQSVRDEAHIRYASVKLAREKDVSEVDSLPKTPEELFAFDVVVLGDISPDDLSELQQKMLDRFVSERGGTLICIAGKSFMPNAYRGRPLQELLPVKLEGPAPDAAEPVRPGVERKVTPFRVQLTDLGAASDLLRLAMEPAENQKVWDRTPPATWRLTDVQPKPSATVLAYAVDVQPPSQEKPKPDGDDDAKNADGAGDQDADAAAKAARERPLIVTQPYGLGQVMFLAWDRTWQLRFKVGDLYHHKLWAQVMRWATAARLPAGSDHVRLGTDRAYYRPGDRVTIRARLSRDDFTPVSDADVAADILCDGKVVQQVNLLPAASAPVADQGPGATSRPDAEGEAGKGGDGVFVARLGPLPGGRYRVKLHVNRAAGLTQNQSDDEVLADFAVAGDDPIESQQLAARSPVGIAAHGLVLTPATAALADQLLGQPVTWQVRIRELLLWSSWWLLGIFCGLAALEWIFRKRVGLI